MRNTSEIRIRKNVTGKKRKNFEKEQIEFVEMMKKELVSTNIMNNSNNNKLRNSMTVL
jgi:hypothetical protein